MRDFTICIGTTFVFGRDAETKVGDELSVQGGKGLNLTHTKNCACEFKNFRI